MTTTADSTSERDARAIWIAGGHAQEPSADAERLTQRVAQRWQVGTVWVEPRATAAPRVAAGASGAFVSWVGPAGLGGEPAVAVVGTRRIGEPTGERLRGLLKQILRGLGLPLVSGGAIGVDTIAHEVALELGLPANIVIAGGLLHPSPARNLKAFEQVVAGGGRIVTDRPPNMSPRHYDFVRRNRLIAALADVVIVAGAPAESGALATARFAAELRRPVLVVPGAFYDPLFAGSHDLLRAGATICTGAADVAKALGRQLALPLGVAGDAAPSPTLAPPPVDLAGLDEVAMRLSALVRDGRLDADEAVRATGLPAHRVAGAMVDLELAGLLR